MEDYDVIYRDDCFPATLEDFFKKVERLAVEDCIWAEGDPYNREAIVSAADRTYCQKFYKQFSIPKKSGGKRTITAPTGHLKDIQTVLGNHMLRRLYSIPSDSANGFVPKRSIKTNAELHLNKVFVYNTDLKDFFPSITDRMVADALKMHGIDNEIAEYVATVCTYAVGGDDLPANVLPQGAPTSPVLSNIVCKRMDYHLEWLAGKYMLSYSRYADDITFSSMHDVYGENSPFLKEFREIIQNYGFCINEAKTRLQKKGERQEVTGLIVGEKANVRRKYLKNLRAEIFQMEMFGYTRDQFRKVKGKLAFVGMVRGHDDPLYRKLLTRVLSITSYPQGMLPPNRY